MVMGRVTDLRPIYKLASELLEFEEIGKHGSQHIFSLIFGQQEYARSLSLPAKSSWRTWFAKLRFNADPNLHTLNMTLVQGKNYEFGIGLDYGSSIFQLMNNSAEDVRSVNFSDLSTEPSSSKTPINLLFDLSVSSSPFPHHNTTPASQLDIIPSENLTWADLSLATNVIIPGYSVPATLSFHGNATTTAMAPTWSKMWYYPHLRALLRHHNRSPSLPIPADQLWDLRGGRGGIWNEAGEWNEWAELCGEYSHEVFGDEKGVFGQEEVEDGGDTRGRPVYNQWGLLMSGKEVVGAETNTVLEEVMEEEVKKGIKGEEKEVVNEGFDNVEDENEKGEKLEQEKERVSEETGKSEAGKEAERLVEEALKKEEEVGEKALEKVKQQKGDLADYGSPESVNENKTPFQAYLPIDDPRTTPLVPGQYSQSTEVEHLQPSNANTSTLLKEPGTPSSNEPPLPGKPLLAEGKGGKIELNDQQSQPPRTPNPEEPLLAAGKGSKIELNEQQSQPPQHTNPTHHDIEETEKEPQTPQGKSPAFDQQPQHTTPKHHDMEETEEEPHTPQDKYLASDQPLQHTTPDYEKEETGKEPLVDSEKGNTDKSPQTKYLAPQTPNTDLTIHEKEEEGEMMQESHTPSKHSASDPPDTDPKPPVYSEKGVHAPSAKYSAPQTPATDLNVHGEERKVEIEKDPRPPSKYSASKVPGVNEEYVDNDAEWSF
jgi:hypothetical protein